MKRIVHPSSFNKPTKVTDPVVSDISIDGLINDGLLALYREIKNILILGTNGKLDASSSRDLRDHLKLLFELKDRELTLLDQLDDETLEKINAEKL